MSLTAEQRAEQNRQNARKSTGPKTAERKARTRENAFKHGLRADVLPIPGEDPEVIAARAEAWNEYYQPQSPAAQHLVNECARATVQSDRVAEFQAASLAWQQGEARNHWLDQREKEVKTQVVRLRKNPAYARDQLLATAAGCRWLITRWEALQRTLQEQARWSNREANDAARMLGGVSVSEDAWLTRFSAAALGGVSHANALQRLYEPGRQPPTLRHSFSPDKPPSLREAREWLDATVAAELARLRERLAELRQSEELPALAEAIALSYVPRETSLARLHLRYQSEARNAFHRAYKSLLTTLDRDAETRDDDSPNEADSACDGSSDFDASPCQLIEIEPEPALLQNATESAPVASAERTDDAKPCPSCTVAAGFRPCDSNSAVAPAELGDLCAECVCRATRIPVLTHETGSGSGWGRTIV
jgi:hypothetical protein